MQKLEKFAVTKNNSKGRIYAEPEAEYRDLFQRDRDRIIHSTAFRRLEYKTQVFVNHEGDLFRTRLTHTLEVAQIARSISSALNLNENLSEAIALAHDLGHTPFGHAGQNALNRCMLENGGFEHNLQSLRVVDMLEERYAEYPGLNLCFETREGILKHCSKKNAHELGDLGKRFIEKKQPSLEAQLTNIADEIAYNNHDIDDGFRAGMLDIENLKETELFSMHYLEVCKVYKELKKRVLIYEVIRRMINTLVLDLIHETKNNIKKLSPQNIEDIRNHNRPLVSQSSELKKQSNELKKFLRTNLYEHERVKKMTAKAEHIITKLFISFLENHKLMPDDYCKKAQESENNMDKTRVIADYIAGMTDRFAFSCYENLSNTK